MIRNKEDWNCYIIYTQYKDDPEVKVRRAYNYADAMRIYNSIQLTDDIEYVELQGEGYDDHNGFIRDVIDMKD
jgi:hypothetical protein